MASTLTSDKEASRSDSGSEDDTGYHSANLLFEYRWPAQDPYSETFMLQEQVVEYLEIRGFSRKYPGECVLWDHKEKCYVLYYYIVLPKFFTVLLCSSLQHAILF